MKKILILCGMLNGLLVNSTAMDHTLAVDNDQKKNKLVQELAQMPLEMKKEWFNDFLSEKRPTQLLLLLCELLTESNEAKKQQ